MSCVGRMDLRAVQPFDLVAVFQPRLLGGAVRRHALDLRRRRRRSHADAQPTMLRVSAGRAGHRLRHVADHADHRGAFTGPGGRHEAPRRSGRGGPHDGREILGIDVQAGPGRSPRPGRRPWPAACGRRPTGTPASPVNWLALVTISPSAATTVPKATARSSPKTRTVAAAAGATVGLSSDLIWSLFFK